MYLQVTGFTNLTVCMPGSNDPYGDKNRTYGLKNCDKSHFWVPSLMNTSLSVKDNEPR